MIPTRVIEQVYSDGPVWHAFSLTRAAYAVFPRRCLQSMPIEWQEAFIALVNEMHARLPDGSLDGDYTVQIKVDGKFAKDPMREYRHTGPLTIDGSAEPTP